MKLNLPFMQLVKLYWENKSNVMIYKFAFEIREQNSYQVFFQN